jgi:hypothetical protein
MSGGKHFNCMRVARTLQKRTAKSRGTVRSGIGIGTDDRLPSFAGKRAGNERAFTGGVYPGGICSW